MSMKVSISHREVLKEKRVVLTVENYSEDSFNVQVVSEGIPMIMATAGTQTAEFESFIAGPGSSTEVWFPEHKWDVWSCFKDLPEDYGVRITRRKD